MVIASLRLIAELPSITPLLVIAIAPLIAVIVVTRPVAIVGRLLVVALTRRVRPLALVRVILALKRALVLVSDIVAVGLFVLVEVTLSLVGMLGTSPLLRASVIIPARRATLSEVILIVLTLIAVVVALAWSSAEVATALRSAKASLGSLVIVHTSRVVVASTSLVEVTT
jgi:hypothetical protein